MHCYDLHSHSIASDGTLTPTQLLQRAKEHGVSVLALTDHDSTQGISEARQAALANGVQLIPGVEISTTWGRHTIHIVGLNIDIENDALQQGLQHLQNVRIARAEKIAHKLEKAGIKNALEGAQALAGQGNVTRTHFARHIVNLGLAKNLNDVFKRYLSNNKPGYVSTQWAPLEDAIRWINNAQGQAVVAHPDRYNMTATKFRAFLSDFKDLGGQGIEVVYSGINRDTLANNARFARDFGLAASVGSDFHSPSSPWVELGKLQPLPKELTPIWDNWSNT